MTVADGGDGAIEAIRQLKARYFRLLDTKQWAAWGEVFTGDATMRVDRGVATGGGSVEQIGTEGRAAIVAMVEGSVGPHTTVHHGHMPEIELVSPTEARGIWAMADFVDYPGRRLEGHGHYHETYRFEDGAWRIASLHLTRLRLVYRD
jgi:hypothetical protein